MEDVAKRLGVGGKLSRGYREKQDRIVGF